MSNLIKPKLFFADGRWRVSGWYDNAHKHLVEAAYLWAVAMNGERT